MSIGEFEIISRYFTRPHQRRDIPLGVGDDAALVEVPADQSLVVALDTIVEGVHFPLGTQASDIGHRAIAVNLSDLASMGARPAWMTLSLSLPQADERWIEGFASGMFALADRYDVALIGGDTVRGPLVVTVQLAGYAERGKCLKRSGARLGDLVFVSGVPGEAAAGLELLKRNDANAGAALKEKFLRPQPRIELGLQLLHFASAAMDVSDGLLTDLRKLCVASGVGADLELSKLPSSPAMNLLFTADEVLNLSLAGGDDYELLFTVPEARAQPMLAHCASSALPLTCIGHITSGPVRCLREGREVQVRQGGYDHFGALP